MVRGIEGDVTVNANSKREVIQSKEFEIRDDNGRTRARIGVSPEGPHVSLYDDTGVIRASLAVTEVGVGLGIFSTDGNPQATFGSGPSAVTTRHAENPDEPYPLPRVL